LLILVAVTLLVLGLTIGSSILLIASIGASLLAAVSLVVGNRRAAARAAVRASSSEAHPGGEEQERGAAHVGVAEASLGEASLGGGEVLGAPSAEQAFEAPIRSSHRAVATVPVTGAGWGLVSHAMPGASTGVMFVDPVLAPAPVTGDVFRDELPREPVEAERAAAWSVRPGAALDGDDPFDEPAPQRVGPDEAARVARMTEPVRVVDGRPRYHLADCPHLIGRTSEALSVGDAVLLGFSPCGRCEPVRALLAGHD